MKHTGAEKNKWDVSSNTKQMELWLRLIDGHTDVVWYKLNNSQYSPQKPFQVD